MPETGVVRRFSWLEYDLAAHLFIFVLVRLQGVPSFSKAYCFLVDCLWNFLHGYEHSDQVPHDDQPQASLYNVIQ